MILLYSIDLAQKSINDICAFPLIYGILTPTPKAYINTILGLILELCSLCPPTLFSSKIILRSVDHLHCHMNFIINLLISRRKFA